MPPEPTSVADGAAEIIPQQIPVSAIHDSSAAELVTITVDRLQLILVKHGEGIAAARSWHTPLGMLIGMISVVLISDFRDFSWVSADTLKAFLWFVTLGLFVWTIFEFFQMKKRTTVDDLVERIKTGRAA